MQSKIERAVVEDMKALIGEAPTLGETAVKPDELEEVTMEGRTKVVRCKRPPTCDCCRRLVKEKSSKPILLGCDAMLCKDCWFAWYDGGTTDPEEIRLNVLREHGEYGGQSGLGQEYVMEQFLHGGNEDDASKRDGEEPVQHDGQGDRADDGREEAGAGCVP